MTPRDASEEAREIVEMWARNPDPDDAEGGLRDAIAAALTKARGPCKPYCSETHCHASHMMNEIADLRQERDDLKRRVAELEARLRTKDQAGLDAVRRIYGPEFNG